jgi:hypothetical protein
LNLNSGLLAPETSLELELELERAGAGVGVWSLELEFAVRSLQFVQVYRVSSFQFAVAVCSCSLQFAVIQFAVPLKTVTVRGLIIIQRHVFILVHGKLKQQPLHHSTNPSARTTT